MEKFIDPLPQQFLKIGVLCRALPVQRMIEKKE